MAILRKSSDVWFQGGENRACKTILTFFIINQKVHMISRQMSPFHKAECLGYIIRAKIFLFFGLEMWKSPKLTKIIRKFGNFRKFWQFWQFLTISFKINVSLDKFQQSPIILVSKMGSFIFWSSKLFLLRQKM